MVKDWMTGYRKASRTNLLVGIGLVSLSIIGMLSLYSNNVTGASLFWGMSFILVFGLLGGYETGKFAEMLLERKRKYPN